MKYILFLILISSLIFSFAPEPTPDYLVEICESTGGQIIETYEKVDCGYLCDAMPMRITDCSCQNNLIYMNIDKMDNFKGCSGEKPICFSDEDCVRTQQGPYCVLNNEISGFCEFQPDLPQNNLYFCPGILIFVLLLAFSKV